ncbi:lanthionine synthetase C family protein [Ulvibacterium marinum]|uniref:Lanthionine synthetase n=1 Tax=Ulvibacterium marinum TaxID=2419782 RepID=A0A3B0BZW4_9FLAO|nr:lanthionine synthetase C family protein [Ulvibacterium marinum]RKN76896.1 hypothetical protein D7Z94_24260 [Ulvibacterium marinum]
MIHDNTLEDQLQKIAEAIRDHYGKENDIGVLSGLSGMALFCFYYAKYLDDDSFSDVGVEIISDCIKKINEGYSYPTYCTGIAGFGWAVQHLTKEEFLSLDCDDLLGQFDEYLYTQMKSDLAVGYYDYLHGAIGQGHYFLSRYQNTENTDLKLRYRSYLDELIKTLEKLSISNGKTLKWESTLDVKNGSRGVNLGLSHGITSILNFAARLYKFDVFKESTRKIIIGSANYIFDVEDKRPENLSLFPFRVETDAPLEYNSRLAWCYGDLGIGLSLLYAANSLVDGSMKNHALEILNHTTKRKSPDDTQVKDAGFCHGSYGNAHIYQKLWENTKHESFKELVDFWIADGIQKAIYEDGHAGYKQWNVPVQSWTPRLSLLDGVAGIGLVIIDYLSEEPNSWDECLMIS